jgi:curved DNA-binding protein CbpA
MTQRLPTKVSGPPGADPYDVLGVARDACGEDIKKAFRQLTKKLHPDANEHDPDALSRFAELCAAYAILGNEHKRWAFDNGQIGSDGKRVQRQYTDPSDVTDRTFTEVEGDVRLIREPADEWDTSMRPPYPLGTAPRPSRSRRWLLWICVLVIGSGAAIYFRQANQAAQRQARSEHTCGTSGWRTTITLICPTLPSDSVRRVHCRPRAESAQL